MSSNVVPIQGSVWTFEDYTERRCMLSDVGHERYDPGYAKRVAQRHTGTAIDALVAAVKQDDDLAAKVKAAESLLNRGWGKAEQSVTMDQKTEVTVRFDWLSKERYDVVTTREWGKDVVDVTPAPAIEASPWKDVAPDSETKLAVDRTIREAAKASAPLKPD